MNDRVSYFTGPRRKSWQYRLIMKLELVIKNAFQKLKKNNIKSALLDSEILLSEAIKKSREFIILNAKYDINEKDYVYFQQMVNQRSKGKPVSYLTGKKFFWKYEFFVNKKVFDSKQCIVMGPTPPGTGDMNETFFITSS